MYVFVVKRLAYIAVHREAIGVETAGVVVAVEVPLAPIAPC